MRTWSDLRIWDYFTLNKGSGDKYSRNDIEQNWMDYNDNTFDIELYKINSIIEQILDPCGYITEYVKQTRFLSVKTESIVTNQRLIYYQNQDITPHLSPLLLEYDKYHQQLYTFAASTLNLLTEIAERDTADYF